MYISVCLCAFSQLCIDVCFVVALFIIVPVDVNHFCCLLCIRMNNMHY